MTHHATRTLQELGYRLTPQRTLVWDVLRASGEHLSAEDICSRIQQDFPNINNSTVYRTLDLLVGLKLVKETRLGPARRFFEVEEEVPHHHLVCETCGRVLHAHDEDLAGLAPALEESHGFWVREVTLFGVCADCCAEADVPDSVQADTQPESVDAHVQSADARTASAAASGPTPDPEE